MYKSSDTAKATLLSPKDNRVYRLQDGGGKDAFVHWKRSVEVHLESFVEWQGATKILREVRIRKTEIIEDQHEDIVAEMSSDSS